MWFLFAIIFASPFHVDRVEIIDAFKTETNCHSRVMEILKHDGFPRFDQKHEIACIKIEQFNRGDQKNVRHYKRNEG